MLFRSLYALHCAPAADARARLRRLVLEALPGLEARCARRGAAAPAVPAPGATPWPRGGGPLQFEHRSTLVRRLGGWRLVTTLYDCPSSPWGERYREAALAALLQRLLERSRRAAGGDHAPLRVLLALAFVEDACARAGAWSTPPQGPRTPGAIAAAALRRLDRLGGRRLAALERLLAGPPAAKRARPRTAPVPIVQARALHPAR